MIPIDIFNIEVPFSPIISNEKLPALKTEIPQFLKSIGNDDETVIQAVVNIISRSALEVIKATKKETAIVFIYVYKACDYFDIPRWHLDFTMNKNPFIENSEIYRASSLFGVTLKGNHTLFYEVPAEMDREKFFLLIYFLR